MSKKIILAYSGGLDTSVICKWLDLQGYETICVVVDIGQREDFIKLKKKALLSGAKKVLIKNVQEEFIKNYVCKAISFNALYEGRYLLGTALARPLIAKVMAEVAKSEKTNLFSHGATGKGNDQVRFELTLHALCPDAKIIAPWRIKEFYKQIKGRKEAMNFAKKYGIPIKASPSLPWSSDANLMHISFEAGILENPKTRPPVEMFEYSVSPQKAPDVTTPLSITFSQGQAVSLNGKKTKLIELFEKLNHLGGINGIGRIDIVESRFVGMKSRGVYETPAGTILYAAHRDLESLTLSREVISLKDNLMTRFSNLVYNGFWFSRETDCLLALLQESQVMVNGTVYLELYKGNVIIIGRESKDSLYSEKIASMEDDAGAYTPEDAIGFIQLQALPLIAEAKQKKNYKK